MLPMNKFQKKLHKEILDFQHNSRWSPLSYRFARKVIKSRLRIKNTFGYDSPCGNCDNPNCKNDGSKIIYCSRNR